MGLLDKLGRADWSAEFFTLLHDVKRWWLSTFYSFIHRCEAKMMGVQLGRKVQFNGHITLDRFKHSRIIIGDNCIFNSHSAFNPRGIGRCILQTATDYACIEIGHDSGFSGVSIVSSCSVKIGSHVMVGAGTRIGDRDDHSDRLGTKDAPVEIADNVFIGMDCIVLKGVSIGENAVIAAGSIVTKDIPANSVAAGVPCRVIRTTK